MIEQVDQERAPSSSSVVPDAAPSMPTATFYPKPAISAPKPKPKKKPPVVEVNADDLTAELSKEARLSELETKRQAKREQKKAERRAKAAAAFGARAEAQRLAEQAANGKGKDDDDTSLASNLSVTFDSDNNSNPTIPIEGEDPAPDNVNEMLKNAVQGNVDPRAWMGGWPGQK